VDLGTSLNVFLTYVPSDEAVRRCAAAGFTTFEFNYLDFQTQLLERTWADEEAWLHQVRAAAGAAGAQIRQLHGPVLDRFPPGTDPDVAFAHYERSLRAAAILGAQWVVIHPLTRHGAFDAAHRRAVQTENVAYFGRLLPLAAATGVGLALENMHDLPPRATPARSLRRRFFVVPEELLDLVDAFQDPLVGICWDTGHAHVQGLDQPASLRTLGGHLKATHIHDNDGTRDQHLLPLSGTIDWPPLVDALVDIGYEGAFALEAHKAVAPLPDSVRDAALQYAFRIGRHLTDNVRGG
jgi:sugar phosphate isomerase/epimerase